MDADHGRYRELFEAMPCYLTVQNRDLWVIEANARFRHDFGDPAGRRCFQVYKQRAEPCEVCPVEETFADGQGHTSEERVRCLDGREVSVIVYTAPIRDSTGRIVAVQEMSTDITLTKRLERQLKQSQARYRQLFEEVPCFITIQDADLRIVDTNRRFREEFGNGLGCSCFRAYKHREEQCDPCPVQRTLEDGSVHHSEEVVTGKDGEPRHVLVYTNPLRDDTGALQGVMEMSTDITPIRRLQSQLESMGLLISSLSHGIKGLLTGLDGGVYLVNTGLANEDRTRVRDGWAMVRRNIDRIRSVVLNILYYAKERPPRPQPLTVPELCEEVRGLVSGKAAEYGIELGVEVAPGAGEMLADGQALRAMLVNLAENAIDACRMDRAKERHAVRLAAGGTDGDVWFSVEDDGIGMDRETREKAFTLFFSSKGTEGTGLGLFVASNIARAHHGRIAVESEPGLGTRFRVTLPRAQPAQYQEGGTP